MAVQKQHREQRDPDLARIRENQRRSRARRKDYLQELEVKYRHCEKTGVEATAEIQAAARRVLDENRRLRELLKQYGLTDAEIDRNAISGERSAAAAELDDLLAVRRSCGNATSSYDNDITTQTRSSGPSTGLRHEAALVPSSASCDIAHSSSKAPEWDVISQSSPISPARTPQGPSGSDHATGTTSCRAAAHMIRSMRPSLHDHELVAELGCRSSEEECNVPNSFVMGEMDRWTTDL